MTSRQEIERQFKIENGIIRDPGKFEGEPLYVPYFYDLYLEGAADDDDGDRIIFDVQDVDRSEFPELIDIRTVSLWEDDQGFVHSTTER